MNDTSPAAARFYHEHLRSLSPRERLRIAARLSMAVRRLAAAGIKQRHPGASSDEMTMHLAAAMYGPQVARRVLGEIPSGAR